jgi:hypothetical protein
MQTYMYLMAIMLFGTQIVFSSCKMQVLVVQASEVPNSSKTEVRATDSAGRHGTAKHAVGNSVVLSSKVPPEVTYKKREMVAYDDLF